MTEYSRAACREWLTTLPQDEPFECCDENTCPVAAYCIATSIALPGNPLGGAHALDSSLTDEIDELHDRKLRKYTSRNWSVLTPREVIAIIDQLEAAA